MQPLTVPLPDGGVEQEEEESMNLVFMKQLKSEK